MAGAQGSLSPLDRCTIYPCRVPRLMEVSSNEGHTLSRPARQNSLPFGAWKKPQLSHLPAR